MNYVHENEFKLRAQVCFSEEDLGIYPISIFYPSISESGNVASRKGVIGSFQHTHG